MFKVFAQKIAILGLLLQSITTQQSLADGAKAIDKHDNLTCKVDRERQYDTEKKMIIFSDYHSNSKKEKVVGVFKFTSLKTSSPKVLGDGLFMNNTESSPLSVIGRDGNRLWLLSDDGKSKRVFQIVYFDKNDIRINLYFLSEREWIPEDNRGDYSYLGKCTSEK